MDLVAMVLVVLLAVVALLLVGWPLARGAAMPVDQGDTEQSVLASLRARRNAALQAVQELDQELALGNLTPEDYRALRAPYVREAALLIREIEGREQVLDEEIEEAVRRHKSRRASSTAIGQHK